MKETVDVEWTIITMKCEGVISEMEKLLILFFSSAPVMPGLFWAYMFMIQSTLQVEKSRFW